MYYLGNEPINRQCKQTIYKYIYKGERSIFAFTGIHMFSIYKMYEEFMLKDMNNIDIDGLEK
ncbi:hypothetical protein [Oceanirhabdus seepicola]|uniref:Uncharacterized protein n=1 Tax=Oceanirhabdus seepicola TaxID=2828781 RepID=A0A9J6P6I6_9CLOT|nr:hypothetical protein [Oceanirhabdus seepicola]MCM1991713.1 hypothetical protein [Oceanirhabdus seepicola]